MKEYSLEEVLRFTVEDIKQLNLYTVNIRLDKLSEEQQDICMAKIRELVRQRDAIAQTEPVDAFQLEDKLRQLHSAPARNHFSTVTTLSSPASDATSMAGPPFQPREESIKKDQKREIINYNTLISEGGIPSFPVEDRVEIILDSGEYQNLIDYWYSKTYSYKIFATQLREWRKFRQFQQTARRKTRKSWESYRANVLNHQPECENSCVLLLDPEPQCIYTTWLEYQHYHRLVEEEIQASIDERLKIFREAQAKLDENDILRSAEDDTFDHYKPKALSDRLDDTACELKEEKIRLEEEMKFARKRLHRASDHPEDIVKIHVWAQPLEREIQLYKAELERINASPKDHYNVFDEYTQSEFLYYDQKLDHTERLLYACLADFKDKSYTDGIEKSTVILQIEHEIQSTLSKIENIDAKLKSIYLRREAANAWGELVNWNIQSQRHRVLMDWIEQQRHAIASKSSGIKGRNEGIESQNLPKKLPRSGPCSNDKVKCKQDETQLESTNSSGSRERRTRDLKRRVSSTSPSQDETPRKLRKRTTKVPPRKTGAIKAPKNKLKASRPQLKK